MWYLVKFPAVCRLPHCVGCNTGTALSTHVGHKCYLRHHGCGWHDTDGWRILSDQYHRRSSGVCGIHLLYQHWRRLPRYSAHVGYVQTTKYLIFDMFLERSLNLWLSCLCYCLTGLICVRLLCLLLFVLSVIIMGTAAVCGNSVNDCCHLTALGRLPKHMLIGRSVESHGGHCIAAPWTYC